MSRARTGRDRGAPELACTLLACAALASAAFASSSARARTGTGDPAEIFRDKDPDADLVLHGQLRLRSAAYVNLDLDRGPSPTDGAPLFGPASSSAPALFGHDARARFSPSFFIGDDLRVFLDVDLFTASLGIAPSGIPSGAQAAGADGVAAALLDVRALGFDWLLPVGVLSVGRMPSHFALGIAANDGAAIDDDGGDRADRIAFVAPVFGHLAAVAVDALDPDGRTRWSESSSTSWSSVGEPRGAVAIGEQAVSLAFMKWRAPWEVELYRDAGRAVFDYGAALSCEWESKGAPGLWQLAVPPSPDAPVVRRDARFVVVDAWTRLVWDRFRIEGEAFASDLVVANPSTIPGVIVRRPIAGNPAAFALIAELRALDPKSDALVLQLETGAASADPAPGFPFASTSSSAFSGAQPGDVFGPQVALGKRGDARFDAARIHPLHRVDLILWRTLLGGVSEAAYARASVEGAPVDHLRLDAHVVYSHAISPDSAPGGVGPLGVELDLGAEAFVDADGHRASLRLDAGNLVPLGGLAARGGRPTSVSSWGQMVLVRLAYAL